MNLADQKQKLIAAAIVVVAIIAIVFVVMRGRGGKQAAQTTGFQEGAGTEVATATEGAAPSAPGEAAPAEAGGVAPAAGPTTGGPSVGAIQMGIGPDEPTRDSPFETFEPPVQPPPPELVVALPPVGIVAGGLRPPGAGGGGEARVGNRRVAGLLFNDQAWAILVDEGGETFIVKPGDVVQGLRITAIARDSLFLMDRDGNRWQVPLRGKGPGGVAGAGTPTASAAPTRPSV